MPMLLLLQQYQEVILTLLKILFKKNLFILTWRPGHAPSPKNMKMDMKDVLSRISGRVEDNSVSTFLDSLFLCYLSCLEQEVSEKVLFLFGDVVQGCVVLLGDEQHMNGCLRIYIVEGEDPIVFVHDFRWDLFVCDFTKNTFIHLRFPNLDYPGAI